MIGGIITGILLSVGLVLCVYALRSPAPRLTTRIYPYVDSRWKSKRFTFMHELSLRMFAILERLTSTNDAVSQRLHSVGDLSLRDFRIRQLQWALVGTMVGLVISFIAVSRSATVLFALFIPLAGAFLGAAGSDYALKRKIEQRSQAITQELPDIAELLALAVGAGQSIQAALERVASIGSGDLAAEIRRTLDYVHAGESLADALEDLAQRCQNASLERFTHALISSLERGTSLGEILREQANDAREYARQDLLEQGGKKEVRMMIPVVFIIMPITVLFTLYPGIRAITFTP